MTEPDPEETPGTSRPDEAATDPAAGDAPFPFPPSETRGEDGGAVPHETPTDAETPSTERSNETVEATEAAAECDQALADASDASPEERAEETQPSPEAAEPESEPVAEDPPRERAAKGALEAIGAQLGVLTAIVEKKDAINAKLHEELTNHRRGQENRRFQPFFTSLIRLEKSMLDHAAHLREQGGEQEAKKIDGFAIELAIALENADVLRLEPTVLDPPPPFDARTQKIVGKVPTDEPGRDGRVAAIVGARYMLDEWTIEKERVRVFQYVAPTETE